MKNPLTALPTRAKLSLFYLLGFAGLRREDVFLVSYPRSGNTWMRFLLCNLVSLCHWEGRPIDFTLLNKTMPELGVNSLLRSWPYSAIPRVVKTHRPYTPLFRRQRAIGIIRDPRDVMVSFYHYAQDRKGIYHGTFGDFIRSPRFGLTRWFQHYHSWAAHWSLVVRYEELSKDPVSEFNRVLAELGVTYPDSLVREAVSRATIAGIRQAEKVPTTAPAGQSVFARSGASQQWVDYFTEEDLAYYHALSEKFGVFLYPTRNTKAKAEIATLAAIPTSESL